jgi:hypothetical protein
MCNRRPSPEKKDVKCRPLCNCKGTVSLAFFLQIQIGAGIAERRNGARKNISIE